MPAHKSWVLYGHRLPHGWHGTVMLHLEVRDLWLGAYWNHEYLDEDIDRIWEVYICILPCLPVHLFFSRRALR